MNTAINASHSMPQHAIGVAEAVLAELHQRQSATGGGAQKLIKHRYKEMKQCIKNRGQVQKPL